MNRFYLEYPGDLTEDEVHYFMQEQMKYYIPRYECEYNIEMQKWDVVVRLMCDRPDNYVFPKHG